MRNYPDCTINGIDNIKLIDNESHIYFELPVRDFMAYGFGSEFCFTYKFKRYRCKTNFGHTNKSELYNFVLDHLLKILNIEKEYYVYYDRNFSVDSLYRDLYLDDPNSIIEFIHTGCSGFYYYIIHKGEYFDTNEIKNYYTNIKQDWYSEYFEGLQYKNIKSIECYNKNKKLLLDKFNLQNKKEIINITNSNDFEKIQTILNDDYLNEKEDSYSNKNTYLIKNKRNGYYKIGRSSDVLRRERTLQSEEPELTLVKTWNSDIESILHKLYEDFRVRGEWFNLTKIQVKYICSKEFNN